MALPTANPPTASPDSFNISLLVNSEDLLFLEVFMVFSPFYHWGFRKVFTRYTVYPRKRVRAVSYPDDPRSAQISAAATSTGAILQVLSTSLFSAMKEPALSSV